jgi:hypothetical protein
MAKTFRSGKGYSRKDWDTVSDNPELTDEQLSKAKPLPKPCRNWRLRSGAAAGRIRLLPSGRSARGRKEFNIEHLL